MTPLQAEYVAHCERCKQMRARPLRYSQFTSIVDNIIMEDINAFIGSFQPEY